MKGDSMCTWYEEKTGKMAKIEQTCISCELGWVFGEKLLARWPGGLVIEW